ncbi:hypothetical protein LTR94_027588, partial [Friedmanniomyces endolithicus]
MVLTGLGLAQAASASCTLGEPGSTQEVRIGETARSVRLHNPVGRRSDQAVPLVLVLHGSGSSGSAILASSGLAETADRHGFIVAAPDAGIAVDPGFVWNIPGVPTITGKTPGPLDADDTAFLTGLAANLIDQGCVLAGRVYVTGLSGGGRMASWLGCTRPEHFAAIAPVVGLRAGAPRSDKSDEPDPRSCLPSLPMPVIAFAGDADTVNPIQGGGAPYWSYPMKAAEQRWAQLNGCVGLRPTRWISATIYEEGYD